MGLTGIKEGVNEWANHWGRRMGIYGVNAPPFPPGHHDDLDAFRHAFCHCILVSYLPFEEIAIDQAISEMIGALIEWLGSATSTLECPREMDYHNNDVGKNLGFTGPELSRIIVIGGDPIYEIAKRVAAAVKADKTINSLDDPRMPAHCAIQAKIPGGAYYWQTQGDEKVRWDHAVRNGRLYELVKPPEGGHPGTEYNCRCIAVPLVKRERLR